MEGWREGCGEGGGQDDRTATEKQDSEQSPLSDWGRCEERAQVAKVNLQ